MEGTSSWLRYREIHTCLPSIQVSIMIMVTSQFSNVLHSIHLRVASKVAIQETFMRAVANSATLKSINTQKFKIDVNLVFFNLYSLPEI
jgi:hypothetical protein